MKSILIRLFVICCTISVFLLAATNAFAQVTPTPVPSLSTAAIVVTVLAFLVGVTNQLTQTGKLFNQWPVPAKAGPYIVTVGSFLGGAYAYLQQQPTPLVINAATIFYACSAGVGMLLVASAPGQVTHLFGGQVNKSRPAATKPSSNAVTLPAPPAPPAAPDAPPVA